MSSDTIAVTLSAGDVISVTIVDSGISGSSYKFSNIKGDATENASLVLQNGSFNDVLSVTSSRDINSTDVGCILECESVSPINLTIQPQSGEAVSDNAFITVAQTDTGTVTLVEGSGVTIKNKGGLTLDGQDAVCTLVHLSGDIWRAYGDLV